MQDAQPGCEPCEGAVFGVTQTSGEQLVAHVPTERRLLLVLDDVLLAAFEEEVMLGERLVDAATGTRVVLPHIRVEGCHLCSRSSRAKNGAFCGCVCGTVNQAARDVPVVSALSADPFVLGMLYCPDEVPFSGIVLLIASSHGLSSVNTRKDTGTSNSAPPQK